MIVQGTVTKIYHACGSIDIDLVSVEVLRQNRYIVCHFVKHSPFRTIGTAGFDVLLEGFCHISALFFVHLSIYLRFCFHCFHRLICQALDRAGKVGAPFPLVVVYPAFVCVVVSDLIAEQVNKAHGVTCIVKAVQSLPFGLLANAYKPIVRGSDINMIASGAFASVDFGAVGYCLLQCQRTVSTARLRPVPLFTHKPRYTEYCIHLLSVTACPECQHITKCHISLGLRAIARNVARKQCLEFTAVL